MKRLISVLVVLTLLVPLSAFAEDPPQRVLIKQQGEQLFDPPEFHSGTLEVVTDGFVTYVSDQDGERYLVPFCRIYYVKHLE